MTIPILEPQHGKCLACGGLLTPDHKHSYVDDAIMQFYDAVMTGLVRSGCLLVGQTGELFYGHPLLKAGKAWLPTDITDLGPHEGCEIAVPHHHCSK